MITDLIANLDKIANDIDGKIIPSNIREGIELFGVEGALEPLSTERREVTPDVVTHVIVPDEQHNGFHEVIVKAVTPSIDGDIVADNIRYGKNILGVNGTLSKLSETDYNDLLELQAKILGYEVYVVRSKLLLEGTEHTYDDGKLITTGSVVGKRLVIN